MPRPGTETPGTLEIVSHPNGPLWVGVTVVKKITAICPKRFHQLATDGKFPFLVNKDGVRQYDLIRVLEILMDGDIPCKPLMVGFADEEVDMLWAYDAIIGGLRRVGRRAPSGRAVAWVLNAGKSEVLKSSIVDWGDRRLRSALSNRQMDSNVAATKARTLQSKAAGNAAVPVVSDDGPSAADKWMADQEAEGS